MNKEEIDYWLKLFSDNNYAFMSKDGKKITLFKVFDKLKKLQQENQKLKKQLENYKKLGFKYLQDKNNNLETQQKEFIKYMNSCIKELEKESPNKLQNTINLGIIDITKTILQKYKEIIGVSDENN